MAETHLSCPPPGPSPCPQNSQGQAWGREQGFRGRRRLLQEAARSPVSIVHECEAWCGHKHSYGGRLLSGLNVDKHSCDVPPPDPKESGLATGQRPLSPSLPAGDEPGGGKCCWEEEQPPWIPQQTPGPHRVCRREPQETRGDPTCAARGQPAGCSPHLFSPSCAQLHRVRWGAQSEEPPTEGIQRKPQLNMRCHKTSQ